MQHYNNKDKVWIHQALSVDGLEYRLQAQGISHLKSDEICKLYQKKVIEIMQLINS